MAAESQFHVLAVDDNSCDRKLITKLLQKSSCLVTPVDSVSKALEFLGLTESTDNNDPNAYSASFHEHKDVEVNLIITDYFMPDMTGYDLLKKVKESPAFKDIPVFIMSSDNNPSRVARCLEEGAEAFFFKPVKSTDLVKLKPHMMKTKLKNEIEKLSNGVVIESVEPEEILPLEQDLKIVEQEEQCLFANKMKSKEEEISTDGSRPGMDNIATAV